MEKNLSQLFNTEKSLETPDGLSERVFARIDLVAKATERKDQYIWGTFFVFSLAAFIGSGFYAWNAFKASNFGGYFSLIFSDTGSLALWGRELGLSLIESVPIFGILIFLASIALVLWSIRKFSKSAPNFAISTTHAMTA